MLSQDINMRSWKLTKSEPEQLPHFLQGFVKLIREKPQGFFNRACMKGEFSVHVLSTYVAERLVIIHSLPAGSMLWNILHTSAFNF